MMPSATEYIVDTATVFLSILTTTIAAAAAAQPLWQTLQHEDYIDIDDFCAENACSVFKPAKKNDKSYNIMIPVLRYCISVNEEVT